MEIDVDWPAQGDSIGAEEGTLSNSHNYQIGDVEGMKKLQTHRIISSLSNRQSL
jgi:hypothetical protein